MWKMFTLFSNASSLLWKVLNVFWNASNLVRKVPNLTLKTVWIWLQTESHVYSPMVIFVDPASLSLAPSKWKHRSQPESLLRARFAPCSTGWTMRAILKGSVDLVVAYLWIGSLLRFLASSRMLCNSLTDYLAHAGNQCKGRSETPMYVITARFPTISQDRMTPCVVSEFTTWYDLSLAQIAFIWYTAVLTVPDFHCCKLI